MKELKFKMLYAIDIDGIQYTSFKYKKDAIKYAINNNGIIIKRKLLTDKY